MDTSTGEFLTDEQVRRMRERFWEGSPEMAFIKPVNVEPTPIQRARKPFPRVGRNEPCPCGSGKKFKKCCFTPQS